MNNNNKKIFISDFTGEKEWGEAYKKKNKLLQKHAVVAKTYSI